MSSRKDRGPTAFLCLLAWRFCLSDQILAQDSVSHDIRSDRSDENPIQLVEHKERGVTFPANLSDTVGQFDHFFIHPGATDSAATAVVAGLRLNLSY